MRRAILLLVSVWACGAEPPREPITLYAAASLARPVRAMGDAFLDETGIPVRLETGGSMELARRLTDLGASPDVLLLADDDVTASLMPGHIDWYVRFATSRLVLAYTPRSRHADSITAENWRAVLARDGVTIGRADSAIAPAGRHALSVLRRAGDYYREPGLGARLMANATERTVRPNAAELAVLLQSGEVDYILEYESVAKQYGFHYVRLPADLSPAVLYSVSIPRATARHDAAVAFVAHLLGNDGRRFLREASMETLRVPVAMGANLPAGIEALVRTMASAEGAR